MVTVEISELPTPNIEPKDGPEDSPGTPDIIACNVSVSLNQVKENYCFFVSPTIAAKEFVSMVAAQLSSDPSDLILVHQGTPAGDGQRLITSSEEKTLKQFEVKSGDTFYPLKQKFFLPTPDGTVEVSNGQEDSTENLACCQIIDTTTCQDYKVPRRTKRTFQVSLRKTVKEFIWMVASSFLYSPTSIQLVLQSSLLSDAPMVINEHKEKTLEEIGLKSDGAINRFIIENIKGTHFDLSLLKEEDQSGTEESSGGSDEVKSDSYSKQKDQFSSTSLSRPESGFVGLVNQAMTCYLNSLIQTLFMTPEFRNAIYRWEFDGTEEEGAKSIPFQLQKLFLQLQTSEKHAVGTTELTTSFGWDSSEAWQQHDIQELSRVMFDALEQKFRNTSQHDLIARLYEGKLKDYVKCLQCGYESAREDTYLDIPLVVKPFGSSQAYGSVEEALRAFVLPEILEGSNQYFCQVCNAKCNAHKGLKFLSFPYILTLQLKRFDFDPMTCHRIKLNDKVVFPEILNLNEFLISNQINKASLSQAGEDSDTFDSGSAMEEDATKASISSNGDIGEYDDEGVDMSSPSRQALSEPDEEEDEGLKMTEENLQKALSQGPYVYELFSILIHSGSANGGHYYAYIKNFTSGEWYCFNDAQVTKITYEDIKRTYGGGPFRSYFSSFTSSTNAYMLMYRQVDRAKNAEPLTTENLPEHIKGLLNNMWELEKKERERREQDKVMCKIKLFCRRPPHHHLMERRLKLHKDTTLAEATCTAYQIMELEGVVPLDCCRLVKYDELHESLDESFPDSCLNEPIETLFGGVKSSYAFDLLLEIKQPHETFQTYRSGGTTLKVYSVDTSTEEVSLPTTVRCHLSDTVEEMKKQIAQALNVTSSSHMRAVLSRSANNFHYLDNPLSTLSNEEFFRCSKVFVEYKDAEDASRPFLESKFFQVLDRHDHTISFEILLPKVGKEILERLGIPPLELNDREDTLPEDEDIGGEVDMKPPTSSSLTAPYKDHLDEGLVDSEESSSTEQHSESSSLTDSERTLVGSPQPPYHDDVEDTYGDGPPKPPDVRRYFRAWTYTDYLSGNKMLRVYVDKRMTPAMLKKELEPWVGVSTNHFELIGFNSNNHQQFDCLSNSGDLSSYIDEIKFVVRLGRALSPDEHRIKVYQLSPLQQENYTFLFDGVVSSGMTVRQVKEEILAGLKENGEEYPIERCRLRKKFLESPSTIFYDHQKFVVDINVPSDMEVILEVTDEPDPPDMEKKWQAYVRWWHPSTLELDNIVDVVLDTNSASLLKQKMSDLSNIPVESIQFFQCDSKFPGEIPLNKIFGWISDDNASITSDSGAVFYFRDKNEPLGALEEEGYSYKRSSPRMSSISSRKIRRSQMQNENSTFCKEKALKIYTDVSTDAANSSQESLSPKSEIPSESQRPIGFIYRRLFEGTEPTCQGSSTSPRLEKESERCPSGLTNSTLQLLEGDSLVLSTDSPPEDHPKPLSKQEESEK